MFNWIKRSPLFIATIISIASLSVSAMVGTGGRGQAMTSKQYSCNLFYSNYTPDLTPSSVKIEGRETWHLHEPSAIGDFTEVRYTSPAGSKIVELKQARMTNQCRTSECYLFSGINFINTNNLNANNNPVVISEAFLVAHKFLQHIREGVWYGTGDARVIHDLKGGFAYEGVQLSRKVGLVPREAWTPLIPFENWDMKGLYALLETKVPEWHNYIRSLAQHHGSWDAAPVRKAEQDAYEQLKNSVLNMTGQLPQQFSYNGTIFTPNQFEQIVGFPRQRVLAIDNKEGYALPSNAKEILNEGMYNHGGTWKYQTGDYNTIINETVRFIEAGQPVIIDFKWNNDGHSMLVVGYEAQNGYVTRLKVMNSWGEDYANDGYVWYTLDDVWKNVSRVYKFGAL